MSGITRRWLMLLIPALLFVLAIVIVIGRGQSGGAAAAAKAMPLPIDGISCDSADHQNARLTVHLQILINGMTRDVPPNLGMSDALVDFSSTGRGTVTSADCYYWLHTGRDDGVIHVDLPGSGNRTFTLGAFFDIWDQPLGTHAVGDDEAVVTSYVNGQRYAGNPRDIPLTNHAVIQLDVGKDVAPSPYVFPIGD